MRRRGHGCGLVLVLLAAAAAWARFGLYPFLARTAPVPADTLVVEGWVVDEQLAKAAAWAPDSSSKSMSISGILMRSGFRNRSKISPYLIGSMSVIPRQYATRLPAADPRPGPTIMPWLLA